MSSFMTPRNDGLMTPYERYLTKCYAAVAIIGVVVLIADLFFWRPDPVNAGICNQPAKLSTAKKQ